MAGRDAYCHDISLQAEGIIDPYATMGIIVQHNDAHCFLFSDYQLITNLSFDTALTGTPHAKPKAIA